MSLAERGRRCKTTGAISKVAERSSDWLLMEASGTLTSLSEKSDAVGPRGGSRPASKYCTEDPWQAGGYAEARMQNRGCRREDAEAVASFQKCASGGYGADVVTSAWCQGHTPNNQVLIVSWLLSGSKKHSGHGHNQHPEPAGSQLPAPAMSQLPAPVGSQRMAYALCSRCFPGRFRGQEA